MDEEVQEFQQVELGDLSYFWLPNGAPCFLANREDICDQVEGIGFQIYYLIGNEQRNNPSNGGKTTGGNDKWNANHSYTVAQEKYHSRILKVVKNIVGRAVAVVHEDFGDQLVKFKEEAEYSMPPIPSAMVDKLDEFFRLVHAQHGTESIVMLTFDPTRAGSEGWGILVPEQTNTPSHCKYDPDSVAALKEDHVIIVGSVHSHPEMSAYASGTDHEDQADFDGLHITFGWQKSVNNGMTQYHVELQMGGSNYILDVEDVFESFKIEKDPDPEVVEWTSKVKKSSAPASGAYNTTPYGATIYHISGTSPTGQHGSTNYGYNAYSASRFVQKRSQNLPFEITDGIPANAVLVAEIDTTEIGRMLCPSCGLSIFKTEIYLGSSCPSCDIPIVAMNTHIDQVIRSVNGYQNKRNRGCNVPYYLWAKNYQNGKSYTVLLIKAQHDVVSSIKGDDNIKVATFDADDEDDVALQHELRKDFEKNTSGDTLVDYADVSFELDFWDDNTWCCATDVVSVVSGSAAGVCNCSVMVDKEDAFEFDEFCYKNDLNVYKAGSDCEQCIYWYTGGCDSYRQAVVDYKTHSHQSYEVIVDNLEQNLNVEGCEKWQKYKKEVESEIREREMPYDSRY
jgi:hypothetical protein